MGVKKEKKEKILRYESSVGSGYLGLDHLPEFVAIEMSKCPLRLHFGLNLG